MSGYLIVPSNINPKHLNAYRTLMALERSGKKYCLTAYHRGTDGSLSYQTLYLIRRKVREAMATISM